MCDTDACARLSELYSDTKSHGDTKFQYCNAHHRDFMFNVRPSIYNYCEVGLACIWQSQDASTLEAIQNTTPGKIGPGTKVVSIIQVSTSGVGTHSPHVYNLPLDIEKYNSLHISGYFKLFVINLNENK